MLDIPRISLNVLLYDIIYDTVASPTEIRYYFAFYNSEMVFQLGRHSWIKLVEAFKNLPEFKARDISQRQNILDRKRIIYSK